MAHTFHKGKTLCSFRNQESLFNVCHKHTDTHMKQNGFPTYLFVSVTINADKR